MSKERLIELLREPKPIMEGNVTTGVSIMSLNEAEHIADKILADGWIRLPCKVGDEIDGEVVCQIKYLEDLGFNGEVLKGKIVHTCEKDSTEKLIHTSHPITWEEATAKLKDDKIEIQ